MNLTTSRASRHTVESSSMEVQPPAATHMTGVPLVGEDGGLGDASSRDPCYPAEPLPTVECNSYEVDGRRPSVTVALPRHTGETRRSSWRPLQTNGQKPGGGRTIGK